VVVDVVRENYAESVYLLERQLLVSGKKKSFNFYRLAESTVTILYVL